MTDYRPMGQKRETLYTLATWPRVLDGNVGIGFAASTLPMMSRNRL